MISKIRKKIIDFFNKGSARSIQARKHILLALIFKGLGILLGFIYYSLSLDFLGKELFGVLLVVLSVVDWFIELDIGIGNGLRNKLGESAADKDDDKAKGYVSTAYFLLSGIALGMLIIFLSLCYFLPWSNLLKIEPGIVSNQEIAFLAMILFFMVSVRFVTSLIYQIFFALQRSAMVDLFTLIAKAITFVLILLTIYFANRSILFFGLIRTVAFAFVPLIIGIIYFRKSFKAFRPSYKFVRRDLFKGLFTLGTKFFIIKICMVIIYSTNNFLISRLVSIDEVPAYASAYKYMSIFSIIFVIITNQIWAANVEAYRIGDLDWMKKTLKRILQFWGLTLFLVVILILISPFVYQFWLKGKIDIPLMLTIVVGISISITNWVNLFNLFTNGAGKIRLQMILWVIASILNIPLSILFAQGFGLGTIGVALGTIASLIPLAIGSPIQVRKILTKKDRGIWAK